MELVDRGYRVVVVIASCEAAMLEAVEREQPGLIVAPMLKKVILASIWQKHPFASPDEASKPLQAYREEELQQMWLNFFRADRSHHLARKHFVYKGLIPAPVVTASSST